MKNPIQFLREAIGIEPIEKTINVHSGGSPLSMYKSPKPTNLTSCMALSPHAVNIPGVMTDLDPNSVWSKLNHGYKPLLFEWMTRELIGYKDKWAWIGPNYNRNYSIRTTETAIIFETPKIRYSVVIDKTTSGKVNTYLFRDPMNPGTPIDWDVDVDADFIVLAERFIKKYEHGSLPKKSEEYLQAAINGFLERPKRNGKTWMTAQILTELRGNLW